MTQSHIKWVTLCPKRLTRVSKEKSLLHLAAALPVCAGGWGAAGGLPPWKLVASACRGGHCRYDTQLLQLQQGTHSLPSETQPVLYEWRLRGAMQCLRSTHSGRTWGSDEPPCCPVLSPRPPPPPPSRQFHPLSLWEGANILFFLLPFSVPFIESQTNKTKIQECWEENNLAQKMIIATTILSAVCFRMYYGPSCKRATLFTKLWLPRSEKQVLMQRTKVPPRKKFLKSQEGI